MAGLLPSLAAGLLPGSERWGHAVMRPGEHPMVTLETTLLTADPGTRLVLVVDQFEEAFTTTTDDAERDAFLHRLVRMADEPEAHAVVVTIRADYTGHVAPYRELADLLAANLVLVGPMTTDELRRAIELPARRAGLRVESALADVLVAEVADEPGGLPLLSTTLVELWRARDEAGWLRLDAHERTGGVRGAVARLAEDSYDQLGPAERDAVRSVLLRLVGEGEGEAAVRRRVPVTEFDAENDPAVAAVLGRLTEDRLLTRDDGMIEIAHEALIREWPRLRGWLEEDATGRQLRGHLTQAARQWEERGRDPGDLYRGARLSATLDWAQQHDREINALEREFLAQGRQGSEREADRQRRTNRRLRGLLAGVALFLVVALVAGALALIQRGNARDAQTAAEQQALRSDAERVGALAQAEPKLDRQMLLAVLGTRLADLPETRGNLLRVLQSNPLVFHTIRPSANEIDAVAISSDGRVMASGDSAGVVRFHNLRTWRAARPPVQLEGAVSQEALAFSPDGRTLAVGTTSNDTATVALIDLATGAARPFVSRPSTPAFAGPIRFTRFAFSPDGSRIAVGIATAAVPGPVPSDQWLGVLAVEDAREIWSTSRETHGANEAYVAFPTNDVVVTSAQQDGTTVWDAATGRVERTFDIGGPFDLSPDGTQAAIGENNANPFQPQSVMGILDLTSGKHRSLSDLPAAGWIISVAFAPDAAGVYGVSFDGGIRRWDVATGAIGATLTETLSGLSMSLSDDGATLVSASSGGSITAWDLSGTRRLGTAFTWRSPEEGCPATPCFVIDPRGGSLLASDNSVEGGATVSLVDLGARRVVGTLPAGGGEAQTDALAFTPDGTTLVTGDQAGVVTLWDVAARAVDRRLPRFRGPVLRVAVSPDGKLLGVQFTDPDGGASVRVFDMTTTALRYERRVPNGAQGLEFSPDGRLLAALGCCDPGSAIRIWGAATGASMRSPSLSSRASSIVFSPDGRVLAIGAEDGNVVLWDTRTHRALGAPFQAGLAALDPLSFSPDGRLLAVTSGDGTVTLWDVDSRKRVGNTFPVEQGSVPVARFAPGGDLVIDNLTNTATWPTGLDTWVDFACGVAGRDLTPGEWSDLLPDRPYEPVCPQSGTGA